MYRSETGTDYGNYRTIRYCRGCGFDKDFCMCWLDFMGFLERKLHIKLKLDIYKCPKIKTKQVCFINKVRKLLSSISGMKGIALLKRIDKL